MHYRSNHSQDNSSPLKTTPRLELPEAAIGARLGNHQIGARLGNHIKSNLKMSDVQVHYWTDSMITLHYIKTTVKQWKPFIANRVDEILKV